MTVPKLSEIGKKIVRFRDRQKFSPLRGGAFQAAPRHGPRSSSRSANREPGGAGGYRTPCASPVSLFASAMAKTNANKGKRVKGTERYLPILTRRKPT